jgi:ribosomal protein L37AE/L43A
MKGRCPECGEGEIIEGSDGRWRCEKCLSPGKAYLSREDEKTNKRENRKTESEDEHSFSWMGEE